MLVEIVAQSNKLNEVLPEISRELRDILTIEKLSATELVIRLQSDDLHVVALLFLLYRNGSIQSFKVI